MKQIMKLAIIGAFGGFFLLSSQPTLAKKCGKRCKASKRNHKAAKKDCKDYLRKHRGSKCVVKKASRCPNKWKTLRSHKGFGTNYRSCIPKANKAKINRKKAETKCRAYKRQYNRACYVRKGVRCGKGLRKLAVFGKGSTMYRACRKKRKNEGLKKLRNIYNSITFLVNAYKIYFKVASGGASTVPLPAKLRKKYQRHFSMPLSRIRVGQSSKIKASGMTDCYKIYFKPHRDMLTQIRNGVFNNKNDERFFLHELSHSQQCYNQGGRNNYAKLWFKHVAKGTLKLLHKKKKVNNDNIHAVMPMEIQAESNAKRIQKQVKNNKNGN